mgnify:FL=1
MTRRDNTVDRWLRDGLCGSVMVSAALLLAAGPLAGCHPEWSASSATDVAAARGATASLWREEKLLASEGDLDDYFGISVSGAGDIDGDGFADFILSLIHI